MVHGRQLLSWPASLTNVLCPPPKPVVEVWARLLLPPHMFPGTTIGSLEARSTRLRQAKSSGMTRVHHWESGTKEKRLIRLGDMQRGADTTELSCTHLIACTLKAEAVLSRITSS